MMTQFYTLRIAPCTPALLTLLILVVAGCGSPSNPDADTTSCITMKERADWEREPFKSGYTIQIPPGYEGQGMVGFEGNTFERYLGPDAADIHYAYCDALFCSDFGDAYSADGLPSYDTLITPEDVHVRITPQKKFCRNGEAVAWLYLGTPEGSEDGADHVGRLFMLHDGLFREAVDVWFTDPYRSDVYDILASIRPE